MNDMERNQQEMIGLLERILQRLDNVEQNQQEIRLTERNSAESNNKKRKLEEIENETVNDAPQEPWSIKKLLFGWASPKKQPIQQQSLHEPMLNININIFIDDPNYSNTTKQLMQDIRNLAAKQSVNIKFHLLKSLDNITNDNLTLFVKYCGSARFDGTKLNKVIEQGKLAAIVLFRYGKATQKISVPISFNSCSVFEFFIDSLETATIISNASNSKNVKELTQYILKSNE